MKSPVDRLGFHLAATNRQGARAYLRAWCLRMRASRRAWAAARLSSALKLRPGFELEPELRVGVGRFESQGIGRDPEGLAGGLNLYGFANGDPVNFSDPFGLMECPPFCDPEDYEFLAANPKAYAERLPLAAVALGVVGAEYLTARVGIALMARLAPAAAGAGAAAGKIPFAGFQQWGREVVQWGGRASGAIERAAQMTAEQAATLDPTKVRQALDFYRNGIEAGRGGAAAPERMRLMERILELQQRQP